MDDPTKGGDLRPRLERAPLGQQIANVIRNDILYGRLKPGERISQQQLCDRYGTSRMPVRDALRQLAYEGFILDDGNRHAVVAPFSRSDLEDIYLIEGMLHALATRRIVEQGSREDLDLLQDHHERMLKAAAAESTESMARINWSFHRSINKMSGSSKLIAVLRTHSLSIPRDYLLEFPQWIERANEQHEEILAAMWKGNAATAERLMRQHVVDAGKDLITYLEDRGAL
jgi:DNA-binding GntR family transcriptional regulator